MEIKRKRTSEPATADQMIGARVRIARLDAVMSQAGLGRELGVSYQQVQKWEAGETRLTAATLVKIAKATNRPMAFFLADLIPGADWNASEDLLAMFDALEGDQRLFLADFVHMTPDQRRCIGLITRDLANANRKREAA